MPAIGARRIAEYSAQAVMYRETGSCGSRPCGAPARTFEQSPAFAGAVAPAIGHRQNAPSACTLATSARRMDGCNGLCQCAIT